jgi:hypothetical protein
VYVQGASPKTSATFPLVRFSNSSITIGEKAHGIRKKSGF